MFSYCIGQPYSLVSRVDGHLESWWFELQCSHNEISAVFGPLGKALNIAPEGDCFV